MSSLPRMRKLDPECRKLAKDGEMCFFYLKIGNEVENKAREECQGPDTTMSSSCPKGSQIQLGGLLLKSSKSNAPIHPSACKESKLHNMQKKSQRRFHLDPHKMKYITGKKIKKTKVSEVGRS